jgi:ankyrin repeat protein
MSDESLHIAASAGDFETSKMLIESGMDVNALDIEGGYIMNVDFHFQCLNTFLYHIYALGLTPHPLH